MSLFDDLPPARPAPRARPAQKGAQKPGHDPAQKPAQIPATPHADEPLERDTRRAAEPEPPAIPVVPVGQLTRAIAEKLTGLGRVAVEGEVSGLKEAGSGHLYFSLKDEGAVLACVVWRSRRAAALRAPLDSGANVVCHGRLDVYAPRGSYSLIVERIEHRGLGELLARLEAQKAELARRGWFDRRRPLPPMPRRIGVVTSRDSDGFQDFLRTRSLRWPGYPLRLVHTRVQGSGAAQEIADAIDRLDASGVDVVCVVRGGGSLEDLWCFNELPVAEAIWRATVPVVTGVGHETDVTLADLVADHRAHTPTDAAQTVIPDQRARLAELERLQGYLGEAMHRALRRRAERLDRLVAARTLRSADWLLVERLRGLAHLERRLAGAGRRPLERASALLERAAARLARQSPALQLERLEGRLTAVGSRLAVAVDASLADGARRLELAGRGLEATSPFAVLARGYSITRRVGGGTPVRDASELAPGERIETLFDRGAVISEVGEVRPGADPGENPDENPDEHPEQDPGETRS